MKRVVSVLLCVLLLFSCALPVFAEGDIINNYTNETDLTPVTSWLRDIYDGFTEWLSRVNNNIANGFNALYDTLRTVMDNVRTAIVNSVDGFKTAMKNLGEEVKRKISDVVNNITYLYNWITNTYEKFKQYIVDNIEYYFVPTFSLQEQVETWKDMLLEKFACFGQITDAFSELFKMVETDKPPTFPITYKGVTVGLVDFSAYDAYRPFVHMLIVGFAWFAFLRRVLHSLPDLIMGGWYFGSSRNDKPVQQSSRGD